MPKNLLRIGIRNVVVVNNPTESVFEIHIFDALYNKIQFDWWTGEVYEDNIVEDIVTRVKEASPSRVKMLIDCEGGDAKIGLAVYNFLKSYNTKVETDGIGMVGSIASVLLQTASKGKRKVARNSFVVIHKAWGCAEGNSDDLRAAADVVDKYTDQIVDVYVQNNTKGKTAEEIKALIENGDYWMTGQEAVDMGFADECYNENVNFQIAARVKTLDRHYKNVPQNLVEPQQPGTDTSFKKFVNDSIMEIKNLVTNFVTGLKGAKPAEGQTVSNEVLAAAFEAPLTSFLTEVQNQINADIANGFKGEAFDTAIANAVSNALKSNKAVTDLQTQVQNLVQENTDLKEQLEKIVGGEGSAGGGKNEGGDEAIGSFK